MHTVKYMPKHIADLSCSFEISGLAPLFGRGDDTLIELKLFNSSFSSLSSY